MNLSERFSRSARFFLILLLLPIAAQAICPVFPAHYSVGADVANCSYNTIQAAIDAVGGCPVVIDVTREHLYGSGGFCTPSQSGGCHLHVDGKNVTLQGWGDGVSCYDLNHSVCASCGPGQTGPLVTLDAANAGGSVLSATSGNGATYVTLRNLTLTHGATAYDGSGGGINYNGHGSLMIEDSFVSYNYAGYGGGINMKGAGGSALLTLGANSVTWFNTAQFSGGGVRLEGDSRLIAIQPQTLIGFNTATGHNPVSNTDSGGFGGGLEVLGPAQADIGSPGYGSGGVIDNNHARYGGGISANAPDDLNRPDVRLFTVDAANPVRISNNAADNTGGGIYLGPYVDESGYQVASLCATNFRIDHNVAQEGTAIYGDADSSVVQGTYGSILLLNVSQTIDSDCNSPQPLSELGSVECTPGLGCNSIDNNTAQNSSAVPTAGSAVLLQNVSYLTGDRLMFRGNHGAHAIRGFDAPTVLSNCLIVENTTSGELLRQENQGDVGETSPGFTTLQNCTISANTIGGTNVVSSAHGLILADSIVDQPGVPTLAYSGNSNYLAINYVLSNDTSTLSSGIGVVQGAPTFVAAAQSDFHLQATSLGIDFAPPIAGDDRDRDGLPHDQDLLVVPNLYGDRDLGAYERQYTCAADTVFCNGFDAYQ